MQGQTEGTAGVGYGAEEAAMQAYRQAGAERAMGLGNRGPIRFKADGTLADDILEAYWRVGFYVFEGVIAPEELAEIERDIEEIKARLPVHEGSPVDAQGRPALAADCKAPVLNWSKPLGDPMGGTDKAAGRHPVKMYEPTAAEDAPSEIVYLMLGTLQFSEAHLRLYGDPRLLGVAASINGQDFAPFNESIFLKAPGLGASVAWHQDGVTHYDSPHWDEGIHGYNTMAQLYGSTPANGVWVVPGSHKLGKLDIKAMVAKAGTERLPDAAPIITAPGDVAICNRQAVHGSFANTSDRWRVTLNFGFHRRAAVLGVRGGGLHNAPAVYDDARIRERSRVIGYAINARRQRFPHETPFAYQPFVAEGLHYDWDDAARASLHDYNLLDLSI